MLCKAIFTRGKRNRDKIAPREGKIIYLHPLKRYAVVEFKGYGGNFRESFWPEEIIHTGVRDGKKKVCNV